MITLDTSGVVALVSVSDRRHEVARDALGSSEDDTVVPAPILAEIAYMLETRVGPKALRAFLDGLIRGETYLDCADADLPRTLELMDRYTDLPLGFADSAVIACAERSGGKVLTFDRRDFEIVAAEVPITIVP